MDSKIVAPGEDDLLFHAVATATEPSASVLAEVRAYDFRRPARLSKDRKRSLQAMYGLLSKSIESWTSGRVRDPIEVELQNVDQLTFGEFMSGLPSPSASYIIDVAGTGRQGVFDFGHEFAYFLVDRLLGGAGNHLVPARSLTTIERMVVRIVAGRVASLLSDVWGDYVRLELEVTGFESIPEMLQIANPEEPVLVANLGVTMGQMSSSLQLCLPFAVIEKFFVGHAVRRPAKSAANAFERTHIEGTVRDARVVVGARLPQFHVPLALLAALQPGSVLATGLPHSAELELFIAGQRRFSGSPGRIGRNLAVRVNQPLKPQPTDLIAAERDLGWLTG